MPDERFQAFETRQEVYFRDARDLGFLGDGAVDLVVTSPPYPMVAMWDALFTRLDPAVGPALEGDDGAAAFEAMHRALDPVWKELHRVLRPGGMACINVGDAVRTVGGAFRIYANHARILQAMEAAGFTPLPDILWRKQTNAPNKFMGSGMLPPGAYVTYEHEYVLLFRKGGKRVFRTAEEKALRRASAYFWEERNAWFSDVWSDLKGAGQRLDARAGRARSGAFPFELAFRLVCMFSLYGDRVLDPFLGTGTTLAAALAAGRSGVGVERDRSLEREVHAAVGGAVTVGAERVRERRAAHAAFVAARARAGSPLKHWNRPLDMPVVTAQEEEIVLLRPAALERLERGRFRVTYRALAPRRDGGEEGRLFDA